MIARIFTILICIAAIVFGILRMGIGAAMYGMEAGWWSLGGEFAEVLPEARDFLAEHAGQAIFAWSVSFYFGLIVVMGAALALGGALYLRGRRQAGLALMALYLAIHGGMFLNYQLINPKIWLFAATVALWLFLWWRSRVART